MRSTLYLKFISIYLIFGFLCLFTVATLTHELTISELEEDTSDTLYKEATLLANDYLTGYFTDDLTLSDIHTQLNGMSTYLHASTWFIDRTGQVILSAGADEMPVPPSEIPDFDPAENGSSKYLLGTYHDLFDKKVITVIAPVTQGFTTKGYLLLHKPYEDLEQQTSSLLRNVYITIVVIYILSFCILLAFHFFIYQPLRKITEAATQYASGNLMRSRCGQKTRWAICLPLSTIWQHSSKIWKTIRRSSSPMSPTTSALRSHPSKDMWKRLSMEQSHKNFRENI